MNSEQNQELALWDAMSENQNLSEALETPALEDEKFLNFDRRELAAFKQFKYEYTDKDGRIVKCTVSKENGLLSEIEKCSK